MPDDQDYEWLGWLLEHPSEWSDDDLASARSLVANQKAALALVHPRDVRARKSTQELIDRFEAAIRSCLEARGR